MDNLKTPTPNSNATGLTMEEMMKIYSKDRVEEAAFTRDYKKGRDETIRKLEDQIQRGLHVDTVQKGLERILQNSPAEPPIDPEEPLDLDQRVLWRIRVLKYKFLPSCNNEAELVNLKAILDAYRHKRLEANDITTV
ncbi:hypothetical protein V8E54_006219 [Elaphomyces granulatus]